MRGTEGAAEAEGGRASLCATAATGLATLLGSALRVMVDATLAGVAMEEVAAIWDEVAAVDTEVHRVTLDVAATDMEGVSEVDAISAVGVVDPSATSATGLATLPGSA